MKRTAETFAHGRVNLIGEYTDFNNGWVLPTTIPQRTIVRLTVDEGNLVKCISQGLPEIEYTLGRETRENNWADYIKGATKILLTTQQALTGFTVNISSTVPMGSGLSSSAALEIAVLKALREVFALKLTDTELALIGQRIENEFVGAHVGIMDQMACAHAKSGEALFLDTMTLAVERVPVPLDQIDLIIINSGIKHSNSGGDYNQRRRECESAAAMLGIKSLRELSDLNHLAKLPDTERRRARHVATENERVHAAVAALKENDPTRLGKLFYQSHQSMRDDLCISIPEIDHLVELAMATPDIFGARLTGGGFGGSIVAIAKKGQGKVAAEKIIASYNQTEKIPASIILA